MHLSLIKSCWCFVGQWLPNCEQQMNNTKVQSAPRKSSEPPLCNNMPAGSKWTALQRTIGWRHFRATQKMKAGKNVYALMMATCDSSACIWVRSDLQIVDLGCTALRRIQLLIASESANFLFSQIIQYALGRTLVFKLRSLHTSWQHRCIC